MAVCRLPQGSHKLPQYSLRLEDLPRESAMSASSLVLRNSVCAFALMAGCAAASIGTASPAAAQNVGTDCGHSSNAISPGFQVAGYGIGNNVTRAASQNNSAFGIDNITINSGATTAIGSKPRLDFV
jgi:hypothetical protein